MSNESGKMIMGALTVTTVAAGVGCLATIISQQLNRFINNPYKNLLKVQTKTAERIGHPEIIINQFEDMIADGVVNVKELDVNLESIGGLEHIKRKLHETIILPLQRPEIFNDEHFLGPQKGVLLYGPPGTGKTMLAKALAKESSAVFINVRMSTVMSKWFGEAQKLVSAIFSLANKLQPAIIFIDEVDSFLGQRAGDSGYYNSMKTEFMSLWDGFTTSKNARVLVLAATNRPTELDEAILRRFTQTFEVGLPDQTGRAAILKSILKKARVEDGIDYNHIASLTPGYSGSDLLELCREAAYYPIRDLLDGEKQEKATKEEEEQKKAVQNDKEQKKANPTHITRALAQADLETAVSAYKDMKASVTDFKSDRQLGIWSRGDELYKTLYI